MQHLTNSAASRAGFCSFGPQRDQDFAESDYGEELYALYLLSSAQGRGYGSALLAFAQESKPFTCRVVAKNHREIRFYERQNGLYLGERAVDGAGDSAKDLVYGWT